MCDDDDYVWARDNIFTPPAIAVWVHNTRILTRAFRKLAVEIGCNCKYTLKSTCSAKLGCNCTHAYIAQQQLARGHGAVNGGGFYIVFWLYYNFFSYDTQFNATDVYDDRSFRLPTFYFIFLTIMQSSIFSMAHNYYFIVIFLTCFNHKKITMITWNFKLEIGCTYKTKFQLGTIQKMFGWVKYELFC